MRRSPSSSARVWPAADVGRDRDCRGRRAGTFFFHFPSKEHVLLELEWHEEARVTGEFARFLEGAHDLIAALTEVVHLVTGLEQRLGPQLFKEIAGAPLLAVAPP